MGILNSAKKLFSGQSRRKDTKSVLKSNAKSMIRHTEGSSIEFISVSDKCFIELRETDSIYTYRIMCEKFDELSKQHYFEECGENRDVSFDSRAKAIAIAKGQCQRMGY